MSDEHDSWFSNVFGVDLGGAAQKIQEEAKAAVTAVSNVVTQVESKVSAVVNDAVNAVSGAVSNVVQKVTEVAEGGGAGGGGLKSGGPAAPKPAVAGGGTGKFPLSGSVGRGGQNAPNDVKAVQRALGIPDDGQCGGGTIAAIENYQRMIGLANADGRVDAGGGTERALAGGAKPAAASSGLLGSLGDAASSALDWANDAGKAVLDVQSGAWDATKGAYKAATGAYDSVAPNFTQMNKDLGELVDWAEGKAKKGNDLAASQYGDVPVLGSVVKASSAVSNAMIDTTGGLIKGGGDLVAMGGNAIVHPIDSAAAMVEGALGMVEHGLGPPGASTTVKAIRGASDLVTKGGGEYGNSVEELAENLALGTHRDPKTGEQTNADLDFWAGIGGGKEAWTEKPAEAAVRTLVNLAPMFLGEEGAGGSKPPPEGGPPRGGPPKGGIPEGGPPKAVDPFGKTQVDPFGKTQPGVPVEGPVSEIPPTEMPPTEMPPTEPGEPPTLRTPAPEPFDPAPSFRDGPNTEVNPSKPGAKTQGGPPKDVEPGKKTVDVETKPPEVQIAVDSLLEAEQKLADCKAIDALIEDAHIEATQKEIRYRTEHHVGFKDGKPVFKNGKPVFDASYDPELHAELKRQADLRGAEHDASVAQVKAAKKAVAAAEKALRDAESPPKSKRSGLDELFKNE